jgi:hypothetical protein
LAPRSVLRVFGWTYVVYHSALAVFFLVSAIHDVVPGSWREPGFQLEMLFAVLVYPAIVPAFAVCGGLHDRCTTTLGHVTQVVALGVGLSAYLLGWWLLASPSVAQASTPPRAWR